MAKSPTKRRRGSRAVSKIATPNGAEDYVDDDENPKDKKQTKIERDMPTQKPANGASTPMATSGATQNPPPMQSQPNPTVPASAVMQIPPPPIDESAVHWNDDMIPPAMNASTISKVMQETGGDKPEESTSTQQSEVKEEVAPMGEDGEPEDTDPHPQKNSACFSWLLALLLFGIAGSAGFVHQRIVQDLQTQLMGYQQDLDYSQAKITRLGNDEKLAMEEQKLAMGQVENIRGELINLVHEIRYLSRQQLMAGYGPGPKYPVELALEFPGTEGEISLEYMTVDLDGENMPHSVLTFLSQVDAGLYQTRGFGFHHAGDHIVLGSPMGVQDDGSEVREVWESTGFSRLLFHEHSDVVPHVPYTIGFSGRGPNLYFNILDNTQAHRDIRDPCFGIVTRGKNVVKMMHLMAGTLNPGDWKEMEPAVIIRSATILPSQSE